MKLASDILNDIIGGESAALFERIAQKMTGIFVGTLTQVTPMQRARHKKRPSPSPVVACMRMPALPITSSLRPCLIVIRDIPKRSGMAFQSVCLPVSPVCVSVRLSSSRKSNKYGMFTFSLGPLYCALLHPPLA